MHATPALYGVLSEGCTALTEQDGPRIEEQQKNQPNRSRKRKLTIPTIWFLFISEGWLVVESNWFR